MAKTFCALWPSSIRKRTNSYKWPMTCFISYNRAMKKYFANTILVNKMKKDMKEVNLLKDYCDSTSLHGWFFFGGSSSDKKMSWSGFFWLIILMASMSAAVFVMGTTIQGKTKLDIALKCMLLRQIHLIRISNFRFH